MTGRNPEVLVATDGTGEGDPPDCRPLRQRLAPLMRTRADAAAAWGEGDWAAMLRHQMAAAIRPDVGAGSAALIRFAGTAGGSANLLDRSFGELLHHADPPPAALELVKEFAKAARDDPDGPLPAEVAAVLYYASILVARARCGRRISALPDEALRRGAERVLAGTWIDERTRSLFVTGLAVLNGPEDHAQP